MNPTTVFPYIRGRYKIMSNTTTYAISFPMLSDHTDFMEAQMSVLFHELGIKNPKFDTISKPIRFIFNVKDNKQLTAVKKKLPLIRSIMKTPIGFLTFMNE